MNIFVSSAGANLTNERKAVLKQLATMGHRAIAMEDFGASPNPPLEECFAKLDNADLMILILGPTYGSIHAGTGLSYTENEFKYALKLKVPVLAFAAADLDRLIVASNSPEDVQKYKDLVSAVRTSVTHPHEPFENPDQLAAHVAGAIYNYAQSHGELGRRLSPFVTWDEYFGNQLGSQLYLNHAWNLAGRTDVLRGLRDFVSGGNAVAVLYGAGGLGKSRLLLEFARTLDAGASGWETRFLRESLPWSADFPRSLPAEPCVIVVDDAHRYPDLESVMTLVRSAQYADRTKVLLTARPSGKYMIDSVLGRSVDVSQVERIGPLRAMSKEDVRKLAREALGTQWAHYDERLVRISDGSPLVAVVAGRLVRDKLVRPELCSTDDEFKRTVLDRFAEELTKVLPGDNRQWQELLALISALGPVRPTDPHFRQNASRFLKTEAWQLAQGIATLEEHGLLLRRGGLVRITPDVLADHLLHAACVTSTAEETTYANTMYDEFGSSYGANLLRNLSEMQWRIDETTGRTDVLSSIWRDINDEFDSVDHAGKVKILNTVEAASPYQPDHAIEIVERAMTADPSTLPNVTQHTFDYSRKDVLEALPRVLRQTALNPDYTGRSANLLWELGRGDERELGAYPDHAIRIVQELASYEYRKPLLYSEKVLDCAEHWLKQPDITAYKYSPLDIIDQLLEKQVAFHELEGYALKLTALRLNRRVIQPLRDRAIECVAWCLKHPQVRIAARALTSLHKMLGPPVALYGRAISAEERANWKDEQLKGAELLMEFVTTPKGPSLLAMARHEFGWLARKGNPAEVGTRVQQALDAIPQSLDFRLATCMTAGPLDFGLDDVQDSVNRHESFLKESAAGLLAAYDPGLAAAKIEALLKEADEAGAKNSAGQFFFTLAQESLDRGRWLVDHILQHPGCRLASFASQVLYVLRSDRPSEAMTVMKVMASSEAEDLRCSLAHAYAYSGWMSRPSEDDFEIIAKLLSNASGNVRYLVIHGLRRLRDAEPVSQRLQLQRRGIEILLRVDFLGDPNLAEAVFESVDSDFGIPPDLISDEQLKEILRNLLSMSEIKDQSFHFSRFLRYVANRDAKQLLKFLMARITRAAERRGEPGGYMPVPFGFEDLFAGIKDSSAHDDLLSIVVSELSNSEGTKRYWLTQLFVIVAAGFGPATLRLITRLSCQQEQRAEAYAIIAALLREAPDDFIFANDEMCAVILEHSRTISPEVYNRVRAALWSSTQSTGFSRSPGEPSPVHESIRNRANEMALKYSRRLPVADFYRELAAQAQAMIGELLKSDEELLIE